MQMKMMGCRRDEVFFVFAFKICLPLTVTPWYISKEKSWIRPCSRQRCDKHGFLYLSTSGSPFRGRLSRVRERRRAKRSGVKETREKVPRKCFTPLLGTPGYAAHACSPTFACPQARMLCRVLTTITKDGYVIREREFTF